MEKSGSKRVAFSSLKMALATSLSRIFGLVREQAFAATFGVSGLTDAFAVAYRIPNMLRDLFAEGALSSAFVPVFIKEHLENKDSARKLLWSLFILLLLVTGILSLLIMGNARSLVLFVTDVEFAKDPEKLQMTIVLTKIMAPFLCLVSLAALMMGVLNSLKVFFLPAVSPVLFNVAMIFSILFLTKNFSDKGIPPIYALGWGVLLGGLLQFLLQLPFVLAKGYGPIGIVHPFSKTSLKVVKNLGIGTLGVAATQINILVTTILATGTQVGAVSWLLYAFRLFQLPVGVLSVSLAGSNLVHFSDMWKAKKFDQAKHVLQSSYFFSWVVLLPACILLYTMADPFVKLILERGHFGPQDTMRTAEILRIYALGLPFYGIFKIFGPTFFSINKPKIPVYISIFCIFCNIIFCLQFVPIYGYIILAFGTGLSMFLNTVIQTFFLKQCLSLKLTFFFNEKILKLLLAGILCFITTNYLVNTIIDTNTSFLSFLGQSTFVGLSGLGIYAGAFFLLRIH